jgi:hypothetical protein
VGKKTSELIHLELDLSNTDDAKRANLIASIQTNAPNAAVYAKSPAIQALVTSLIAAGKTLTSASAILSGTRGLIVTQESAELEARVAVDKDLLSLKTMVETNAADDADAAACGFKVRVKAVAPGAPLVPLGVKNVRRKARGQVTMSAEAARPQDTHFAAQVSVDPIVPATSWINLPGFGKERTVTYPSGTLLWFRFATMRGQTQSAWCTPVSVTVP